MKNNNNYSLDDICVKYYDYIYQLCLKKLFYNTELASDVMQNTFTELCVKWDKLENKNLQAWLRKTAEYKIKHAKVDYIKHKDVIDIDDPKIFFKELAENKEMDRIIIDDMLIHNIEKYQEQVYNKLKDNEIELLNNIRQGLDYIEIAKKTNKTHDAVKMSAFRLRKKVKNIISDIVGSLLAFVFIMILQYLI